jgi:hypothetical protein
MYGDTSVSGICQVVGGPARSSALRSVSNGFVPDSVQSSSVRNGWGLLRVSLEVVLYAVWSLAPTGVLAGMWIVS